jgi:carbohydrate diacid regulator
MEVLTQNQARQIVRRLMDCIPYNINIMNSQGVIIASGDKSRIGTLHLGALRAIREKKIVIIYENTSSERRGTNEPIFFDGDVIGVVGITGEPEEVRPFTRLVSTIVQLFLEEQRNYINQAKAQQLKKSFIDKLMQAQGNYSPELVEEALDHYDLDLTSPKIGILGEKKDVLTAISPRSEVFSYHNMQVTFSTKDRVADRLHDDIDTKLIISDESTDLGQILTELWNTFLIDSFMKAPAHVIFCADHKFYANMLGSLVYRDRDLIETVRLLDEESRRTLITFYQNNSRINKTADVLAIHRNTLHFRLRKIESLTGRDPFLNSDLFELVYHLVLLHKDELEHAFE